MMTFGEQIKQAREHKNFSQEELAEQLGVSRQAVSKWENNSSIPQGANREMLSQILDLEASAPVQRKRMNRLDRLGWIAVGVFLLLFLSVLIEPSRTDTPELPAIKSITFHDSDQNEVTEEALWYNSARIESILIQWEGGTPSNIKLFSTPSGTETMELTELLLTKSILDGDSAALLDADVLKDIFQSHVFLELNFGEKILVSDIYNIFYDEHEN